MGDKKEFDKAFSLGIQHPINKGVRRLTLRELKTKAEIFKQEIEDMTFKRDAVSNILSDLNVSITKTEEDYNRKISELKQEKYDTLADLRSRQKGHVASYGVLKSEILQMTKDLKSTKEAIVEAVIEGDEI